MSAGETRTPTRRGLELAGLLILLVLAARFLTMYFHRGANLLDEGSTVAAANRILHGDVIYRDFLTAATPGSFYTVAWLFEIFGAELIVVRWLVVALCLGTMAVTFVIARHLMSWPFAAASALMTIAWGWFLLAPNLYSLEAMFFALVALACYLQGWQFVAGIACGAAIMTKQNTGLYAAMGLSLSILISALLALPSVRVAMREQRRTKGWFTAGMLLVVVPAIAYLIWIGAGPHLYENWVYYPLQVYPRGLTFEYPAFYPLGDDVWQKLVLYLPALVYPFAGLAMLAFVAHKVWRRAPLLPEAHALLAITLFGAFTFLQSFPRADMTHILFGMQPAFILLGYLCSTLARLVSVQRLPAAASLAVAIFLVPQGVLICKGYELTQLGYQTEYVPLTTERARGVRTNMRNAAQIDSLSAYLTSHTTPGDPVFLVPWAAGFYFLADRPNPTRFDVLLYGDPDVYPCLISTLDEHKPGYIVYGYAWDVDGKRFSEYARPLDDYIRTRYTVAERFDEYEVWRRLDSTEPVFNDNPNACRRRVLDGRELRRVWRRSSDAETKMIS